MFYYAIYVTRGTKVTLLDKDDFDEIRKRFAFLTTYLDGVKNQRYTVRGGQRVLTSFDALEKDSKKEAHFVFKQLKKKKIVPSALK